ncbi:tetratricopeptide repeat protein [Vibrio breoganii]|uniref:tetratricopeptide repeat protein n=1 Tax=Vibrio breoganii TaxID=553239 RepID=UPI0010BD182B|nr:tetratricopeptide repeat protein [Vibrio breoganii]TKG21942.1 tetratricopeptide repeat protein [Vibrio breoganii]
MAFNLTRMTVYALISSVEEDLRGIIKSHISDKSLFPIELHDRCLSRIEKDIGAVFGDITFDEMVDYFDLGDTFQTINSNQKEFPANVAKSIRNLTKDFETLIPIRNRVMHIRPLNFDDLTRTSEICRKLKASPEYAWNKVTETIDKLSEDSSFLLGLEVKNYDDLCLVSHNLPMPDFDETGLIGRDEEIKKIKQLCYGGFPVISIVGEGGVGKSALALKVAYELVEDENPKFDAIVWVTSKTTQITVNEIKDIDGAISDSLGVIQEISTQTAGESSSFDDVIDYLANFKIALFIDNLETILDDNIKSFVGSLPIGSKIIITSRIGLGAFEFPVKLEGIEENYASQLLRSIAKARGVDALAKIDEKVSRRYVGRMHRNPSYIKWFVSCVQTGKAPEAVLQNSDLFLDFCMSNVYDFLSESAQQLTSSLLCAPGLKDVAELAYLNGFDSLKVQKSIQELMATNMLSQASKSKGASIKTTYELSELARSYLGKHHKPTQKFQKLIRDKRNKLNSLFEQQMSKRNGNNYSIKNVKFRDKADRIIVKMLMDSFGLISSGKHDQAITILEEAHRLAPDYFEVARFMAYFHQKSGNLNDARKQYELAIVLAPETPQLHFWFGKFLLHEEENVDEAVEQFIIANKLDDESIDVALALARGFLFQHNFTGTEQILCSIENSIAQSDLHQQKMYYDTKIQIHYRTADNLALEAKYSDSLQSFENMINTFDNLDDSFKDHHIRRKLKKSQFTLNKLSKNLQGTELTKVNEFIKWLERESVT